MPRLKKLEKERKDKMVMVKMSQAEFTAIKRQAARFSDGNVSDWIRFASIQEPKTDDFIIKENPDADRNS